MSLIVGIESPIQRNENLRATEAGKLALFSSSPGRGARVSVLAKVDDDWQAIRQLVESVLPAQGELVLINAWNGSSLAMTATRAEMQRMRLSKQGWTVQSLAQPDASTLFVGALTTSPDRLALPLPREGLGHTIFLRVPAFDLGTFGLQFAEDLGQLAARELAPSLALINWVLDGGGALGYEVKDDFNRSALVVLGKLTLPTTLDGLDVAHVYRDEEAGRVFQQAPS